MSRLPKSFREPSKAWRIDARAKERATCGDVERSQVRTTEGAVGHFVARDGQEGQQLAFRTKYIDASLAVLGGFERRIGFVQAAGYIEPALDVLFEPVGPSSGAT